MYLGLLIAAITILLVKLTVFFQFYRIMRYTDSRLKVYYIAIIVIIGTFAIAQIFVTAVPCIPMAAFWDRTLPGKCVDEDLSKRIMGLGNLITDFVILLLPVPVIWRLRLPTRQKWAAAGVFGIGILYVFLIIT